MQRWELPDFCKGLAMIAIVFFHIFREIPNLQWWQEAMLLGGGVGVHGFIFLSGIGLTLRVQKYGSNRKNLYGIQGAKIYIPYILIVILSAILAYRIPTISDISSRYAVGGHIFLYKMFDETIIGSYGDQFWFISTLFQLYLIFPLLYYSYQKYPRKTILFSFLISSLWFFFLSHAEYILLQNIELLRVWKSFFLQYLRQFAIAIHLTKYLSKHPNDMKHRYNTYLIGIVGILSLGLTGFFAIYLQSVGRVLNDFFALLGFMSIALFLYRIISLYIPKFVEYIVYIGFISYSRYLTHRLVLQISMYIFAMYNILVNGFTQIGVFVLSFIVAVLFNYIGMKKIQDSIKKYLTG